MKILYLLSGAPGCGKSTWASQKVEQNPMSAVHISRDEIRYSLLEEKDEYFSKEDEVFAIFCEKINFAIDMPCINEIYVDATHISNGSRRKLLNNLNLSEKVCVIGVNFHTPLVTLLERNGNREGRARVPDEVVKNMYNSWKPIKLSDNKYIEGVKQIGENVYNK